MWVLPGDQLVAYWSEVGLEDGSAGGGRREGGCRSQFLFPPSIFARVSERDNTLVYTNDNNTNTNNYTSFINVIEQGQTVHRSEIIDK